MSFPSTYPINVQREPMVDPFSGNMNVGVSLPTLKEFLDITKLSQYSGKFKKLKCVETEDLEKAAPRVGLKHVEEQRLRRYLDHYYQRRLTSAIAMEQPISLEDFFRTASLQTAFKPVKALGVVEFDDLFWMAYTDISKIIPKKIEYARFKRYLEKCKTLDPKNIEEPQMVDLKSFLDEASLKKYKSDFEKLGVFEGEDFLAITRSDLPKMPQVEFERFTRHRLKKYGHLVETPADKISTNVSNLEINEPKVPERRPSVPPRSSKPTTPMNRSLSLDSGASLPSPVHSPIQEQPPAYTPTAQYPIPGNLPPVEESHYSNQPGYMTSQPSYNPNYPHNQTVQPNAPPSSGYPQNTPQYGMNPAPNAMSMPQPQGYYPPQGYPQPNHQNYPQAPHQNYPQSPQNQNVGNDTMITAAMVNVMNVRTQHHGY